MLDNINVASVDYSLFQFNIFSGVSVNPWPVQMTDLVDFIEHINADNPDRKVCLYGHSAGAHIAVAFSVAHPQMADCVIGASGPYNLSPAAVAQHSSPITRFAGTVFYNEAADTSDISPQQSVDSSHDVPTMLLHGLDDTTVDIFSSRDYSDALKTQTGTGAWLIELENIDHQIRPFGADDGAGTPLYSAGILAFLAVNLL